jgi:nucleoid-associated protein YgaU
VVAGDSLASIAYAEYGDAGSWRRLAEANDIDDPLRVRDGAVLHIPPP